MKTSKNDLSPVENILKTIKALRHPKDGCPWDLEQTHQSLLPYLLEESYEYIDAVERKNASDMREELGDVLLQVLLHSQLAEEEENFNFLDVITSLNEKLIRRHPHVFSSEGRKLSTEEVVQNWEKIKSSETKAPKFSPSKSRIKASLLFNPALTAAYKIGLKSQSVRFDWSSLKEVLQVCESEWQEFKSAMDESNKSASLENIEEEIGDLFFSLAQLARHLNIDPELALKKSNRKFITRFQALEKIIQEKNLDIDQMNQEQMDRFWPEAKKRAKKSL